MGKKRERERERKIGRVDLCPRHGIVIRPSSYLHEEEARSGVSAGPDLAYSARKAVSLVVHIVLRCHFASQSRKIIALRRRRRDNLVALCIFASLINARKTYSIRLDLESHWRNEILVQFQYASVPNWRGDSTLLEFPFDPVTIRFF